MGSTLLNGIRFSEKADEYTPEPLANCRHWIVDYNLSEWKCLRD
jgi:hypothetical protein